MTVVVGSGNAGPVCGRGGWSPVPGRYRSARPRGLRTKNPTAISVVTTPMAP